MSVSKLTNLFSELQTTLQGVQNEVNQSKATNVRLHQKFYDLRNLVENGIKVKKDPTDLLNEVVEFLKPMTPHGPENKVDA